MSDSMRSEIRIAKRVWGGALHEFLIEQLCTLLASYQFSVKRGDLQLIQGHWYITHTGLLGLAYRKQCFGLHSQPVEEFCSSSSSRWAFQATVYKSKSCRGFVGYGDADPSNVSPLFRGAEMRIAETRAVNRALRKAYGIGLCSVEELGSIAQSVQSSSEPRKLPPQPSGGSGPGGRKVRDHLCQLIRQHQLDPNLVKAYAVDFCGVKTLKDATRDQVEGFVKELSEWALRDRNALLCQLNSYLGGKEGAA